MSLRYIDLISDFVPSSLLMVLPTRAPQGSVTAPALFYLYISDMPMIKGCKFGYTDDLAIAIQENVEVAGSLLSKDLKI